MLIKFRYSRLNYVILQVRTVMLIKFRYSRDLYFDTQYVMLFDKHAPCMCIIYVVL